MKFKINIRTLFIFFLSVVIVLSFIALYSQYSFSKKIIIQNYANKELLFTSKIKERLKAVLDTVEFEFKSSQKECLKKTQILKKLYKKGDFNATKVALFLNKNYKGPGHFEVFVINKNYIIKDASYKPDLGFNLGAFEVYRHILQDVFDGKKKIDISYPHMDYSSMHVKKYYLVLSPNKKKLLQLGYVIDIGSMLRKIVKKFAGEIPDLKSVDIYFVEKYIIYKIKFQRKRYEKIPLVFALKNTDKILNEILKNIKTDSKTYSKKDISSFIGSIFSKRDSFSFFENGDFEVLSIINGLFENNTDRLLLKTVFDTTMLEKNLHILKKRFFIIFVILIAAFLILYKFLILRVSSELREVAEHMKNNTAVENEDAYIKEIEELKKYFNIFRKKLNTEIEKNRMLLAQNRRFIVDTIHQIKTPLSVIMLNIDFIKDKIIKKELKEIVEEIEAAVVVLRNSYEDLSYIAGNGVVSYEAREVINLSDFLKERIKFFEVVTKANHKEIKTDIDRNIQFKINSIEFERLIDNNISNAIKYSSKKDIIVSLKKYENKYILKFESFGEKIQNPLNVFNKNYREHHHKRGLGIGLNIVKEICEKYGINYTVYYQDGKNIFEYQFKC